MDYLPKYMLYRGPTWGATPFTRQHTKTALANSWQGDRKVPANEQVMEVTLSCWKFNQRNVSGVRPFVQECQRWRFRRTLAATA